MKTKILQVFSENADYSTRIERAVSDYCDANGFEYAPIRVKPGGPYWFALDPIRAALADLADGDRLVYLDGSAYFFNPAITPENTIFADDAATPVRFGAYCESEAVRWNPRKPHPGAIAFVVGAAARAFVDEWIARATATGDRSPRSRDSLWQICDGRADLKIFQNYYVFAAKNGYFIRRLDGSTRSERDDETAAIFDENEIETKGLKNARSDFAKRDGDSDRIDSTVPNGAENEGASNGGGNGSENVGDAETDSAAATGNGGDGTGTSGAAGSGTGTVNDAPPAAPKKRRTTRKKAAQTDAEAAE